MGIQTGQCPSIPENIVKCRHKIHEKRLIGRNGLYFRSVVSCVCSMACAPANGFRQRRGPALYGAGGNKRAPGSGSEREGSSTNASRNHFDCFPKWFRVPRRFPIFVRGDGVIEAPGGADIDFFGPPGRVFHNHANRDHTHRPAHGAWRPARPSGSVSVQRIRINRFPTGLVPA